MYLDQRFSCVLACLARRSSSFQVFPSERFERLASPRLQKWEKKYGRALWGSLSARQIDLSSPPAYFRLSWKEATPGVGNNEPVWPSPMFSWEEKRNKPLSLEKDSTTCFYRHKSLFFHERLLCINLIDYSEPSRVPMFLVCSPSPDEERTSRTKMKKDKQFTFEWKIDEQYIRCILSSVRMVITLWSSRIFFSP